MQYEQHMFGLGGVITTGVSLLQASDQHKRGQDLESQQHEEELRQMKEQFRQELLTARKTYLISTYTDVEQYFQELNENLINTSRDAERDMVDQRNQQYQTMLVAATMMLTALLSILYQGNLPTNSPSHITIAYSLSNTASLITLLANVVICIEVMSRVSKFMYKRSHTNIQHLTAAMDQTKKMMRHIRGDALSLMTPVKGESSKGTTALPRTNSFAELNTRRAISKLPEDDVEEEWLSHEEVVYSYLKRRGRINEQIELLAYDLTNEYRMSFQKYWNENCRTLGNLSLIFFYLGTSLMLISTMIFMWAYFHKSYKSPAAALVSTIIILVSLIVCLFLAIYLRYYDNSVKKLRAQMDEETNALSKEYDSTRRKFGQRNNRRHQE